MNSKEFLIHEGLDGERTFIEVDTIQLIMEKFALQVATEAVNEEVQGYKKGTTEWINAKYHAEFILKNIKKRLDADND